MANIFESKAGMPKEKGGYDYPSPIAAGSSYRPLENFPAGASIAVDMTCEQRRNLNMSNYPRYDALDTAHVARPRFGHGY